MHVYIYYDQCGVHLVLMFLVDLVVDSQKDVHETQVEGVRRE